MKIIINIIINDINDIIINIIESIINNDNDIINVWNY